MEQDKLAKQTPGNGELSNLLSELPPLEQVLARVQIRWPYPEMGELERQDWREVLGPYPLEQIVAALDRLMRKPPKMNLADGSVQAYTGRPTVVNVTQTIDELRQEALAAHLRQESDRHTAEMKELQRRKDAGEKFYGMADLEAEAKRLLAAKIEKPVENREAVLAAQREQLLKST